MVGAKQKRLIEEVQKITRINSCTANGNDELVNTLLSMVQDRGMKASLQPVGQSNENFSKRQFNLISILGDPLVDRKTRKGLLLLSPLDTAPGGLVQYWKETGGNPLSCIASDEKIIGLGVSDGKLDFLCKLYAVQRFREKRLNMPLYLVGTCGQKAGMFGARYLIESLALNPQFVVVGSPTGMKLVTSHMSNGVFKLSIDHQVVERDARGFNRKVELQSFGRLAHSIHPEGGIDALENMIKMIQVSIDHGFEMRISKLQGGLGAGQVADFATSELYLSSHQFEDFKRFFKEKIRVQQKDQLFRIEFGGSGDVGIRFLPDTMFPCLLEIKEIWKEFLSDLGEFKNSQFHPSQSTGLMVQVQQHPTRLDLSFELFLLPEVSLVETEARFKRAVMALNARYPSLTMTLSREKWIPALEFKQKEDLSFQAGEALNDIGCDGVPATSALCSEASLFAQKGYDAIAFGPGSVKNHLHAPNEQISWAELNQAISFYERLIEKICL